MAGAVTDIPLPGHPGSSPYRKPAKATSGETRKELFHLLQRQDYDKTFYDGIITVFMHDTDTQKSAAGLANFMTGACLQIALKQEQAKVDPHHLNPNNTTYAAEIKSLVKEYSHYAKKAAPNVKTARLDQIGLCKRGTIEFSNPLNWYWSFTDNNNGYESAHYDHSFRKHSPAAKPECQEAREEYVGKITDHMNHVLQSQVYDVIDNWKTLLTNPVPIPQK